MVGEAEANREGDSGGDEGEAVQGMVEGGGGEDGKDEREMEETTTGG